MSDIEKAFAALNGKLSTYNKLFAYADGDQPMVYSTQRLREAFNNIDARFTQNWCSVVINAVLDRLTLSGFDAKDATVNDALDELWNDMQINIDSYDVHRDTLITEEGFVIAWKDGDILDVYRNDPRLCHMFYKPDRPKIKDFAAKWWISDVWYMTLYYPDRIEYYKTRSHETPSTASAFHPTDNPIAQNDFGEIPIFHFRGNGELQNILTLQDAVNKLFADMMVSAEFGAFRQRYVVSQADTTNLKNSPNSIWSIPSGDGTSEGTQVGQFDATPLDNYLNAIDKISNSIAVISRTPKHYFYSEGGQISGEALLAMEAPLTKKADQYQERFTPVWKEFASFLLRLIGKDVATNDITPVWAPTESIQPYTEAQTRQLAVSSGIPLKTQLKREGWSIDKIEQMEQDKAEEKAAEQAVISKVYMDALKNFDQGV